MYKMANLESAFSFGYFCASGWHPATESLLKFLSNSQTETVLSPVSNNLKHKY